MPTVENVVLGNPLLFRSSSGQTTIPLDAAADAIGGIFQAPRAGDIDRIGVSVSSIAGTSPTYVVALEGVANGPAPDGISLASATPAQLSAGWTWISLGAGATVSAGDHLAATVRYSSGTINGSNNAVMNAYVNSLDTNRMMPHFVQNITGAWVAVNRSPTLAIRYAASAANWIIRGCIPFSDATATDFNTGSAADERGLFFTPAVGVDCVGAVVVIRCANTSSNYDVILYDSSDSVLASRTIDQDRLMSAVTTIGSVRVMWAPVTLTAGSNYRIAVRPSSTNNVRIFNYTFADQDALLAFQDAYMTERADAGAWTTYNNGTDGWRSTCIAPIISNIAAGGAASILGASRMRGGTI
jgi:hypothetical protein